jgi:hypothetical protein
MDAMTVDTSGAPRRDGAQERPLPARASLVGAGGGVLLFASLTALLAEMRGHNRLVGILVVLLFEALGILLMVMSRGRRGTSAGVALTALGVGPLVLYLFVDVENPDHTFHDFHSYSEVQTRMAMLAAALWLLAYFVGPGRRYGLFLGLALVSFWSVASLQIVSTWVESGFGYDATFQTTYSPTDSSYTYGDDYQYRQPEDPTGKLAATALGFGGLYLFAASRRDRKGDRRMATVFYAVSLPILTIGVLYLLPSWHEWGASLLGIALAAVVVRCALPAGRRFSTWYATAAGVFATLALILYWLGESPRASAIGFGAAGLATAGAALLLDSSEDAEPTEGFRRRGGPMGWLGGPGGSSVPVADPHASPWAPHSPTQAGPGEPGAPTAHHEPWTTPDGAIPTAPPEADGPPIDPSGPSSE